MSRKLNNIYIVIGRFTEAIVPVIHLSLYDTKIEAREEADRIGGIVVTRKIHFWHDRGKDDKED